MSKWTLNNLPDQTGRKVVVTGANSGIGFETARALAQKGADVILACRSEAKATAALQKILAETPGASVRFEKLDLSDLDDVAAFAARYRKIQSQLDLLILNAGVMVPPESRTVQGFELQFGVNHLGHFALTAALIDRLNATAGARVVVVSSVAAQGGEIYFDDLQFEERSYAPWRAYGQSKLANQLFTRALQRRLHASGSSVLVTAAHPGWTKTDLQRSSGIADFFSPFFGMKAPQGALPTLRAATDPEAQAAQYFGPDGFMQMRGYPKPVNMVKQAFDDVTADRLWTVSEELTGIRYDLG